MSTIAELQGLRKREDHVEFKEAKHNYPFAGGNHKEVKDRRRCVLGYVVALANEKGGRLVLGMSDSFPHEVVGSDFAEGEVGNLVDEIYERLHIRVRTEELYDKGERVLVINVPSRPVGKALRFEGVPLMRLGESLREMDDAEYFSIISEQDPDFSANICAGLSMEDLDEDAISRLRSLLAIKRGKKDVLSLPTEQLLSDLNLSRETFLTYASLILLGKSSAIERFLPQANISVEYRSSHSQDRFSSRQFFRLPLVLAIDEVWKYISHPASNPTLFVNDMPRILDVQGFEQETTREAILNACTHRNYQLPGDVVIKIYPDCLEIMNPGGFPYGVNVGNILTVTSSPRNRLLAENLEKVGLIERAGQGADMMFANCVKDGKPLPDYSDSDDYQVCLKLWAIIENPKLMIFLRGLDDYEFNAFELLNLYYIYTGKVDDVAEGSLNRLLDCDVISKDDVFRYTMGPLYFSRTYPFYSEKYGPEVLRLTYYAIRENQGASSSGIIEKLSGYMTPKNVRTMIAFMSDNGLLVKKGNGRSTVYEWKD